MRREQKKYPNLQESTCSLLQNVRHLAKNLSGRMLLFLIALTIAAYGLDYSYQQNNRETVLTFRSESPVKVVALDPPAMTTKIVLKITGLTVQQNEIQSDDWTIPQLSAVIGYRCIPYSQNMLLIIDLLHPVDFQLNPRANGFELSIRDAQFRDPVEHDFFRGMHYQQMGEYDMALSLYQQVARARKKHRYVFYKAGQIRLIHEEYQKAETNFKIALSNGCDSLGIYRELSKIYRIYGNRKLAEKYEQQYRKQSPKPAPPANGLLEDIDFAGIIAADSAATNVAESDDETPAYLAQFREMLSGFPQSLSFILMGLPLLFLAWAIPFTFKRLRKSKNKPQAVRKMAKKNAQKVVKSAVAQQAAAEKAQKKASREHRPHVVIQPAKPAPKNSGKNLQLNDLSREYSDANPQVDALIDQLLGKTANGFRPSANTVNDGEDEPVNPENTSADQTRKMARELNLGQGEVELALKLSSMHLHSNRQRDIRSHILDLHRQHLSIDEIAREANLGKGEVELFLRLAKAHQNGNGKQR